MQKIITLLILITLLLTGCGNKTVSTTVASEEEWNQLFSYETIKNMTCTIKGLLTNDQEETIIADNNHFYTKTADYENYLYVTDDQIINYYTLDGANYTVNAESYSINKYKELLPTAIFPLTLEGYYTEATYDETTKSYSLNYNLQGIETDITLKVENGHIASMKMEAADLGTIFDMTISSYGNSKAPLPELNGQIKSGEEWDKASEMPDNESLTMNTIFNYQGNTFFTVSQYQDNKIGLEIYDSSYNLASGSFYQLNDDKTIAQGYYEYSSDAGEYIYIDEIPADISFEEYYLSNLTLSDMIKGNFNEARYDKEIGCYIYTTEFSGKTYDVSLFFNNGRIVSMLMTAGADDSIQCYWNYQ